MYTMEYVVCEGILFSHKNNEIMPSAAAQINLEITILSEVSLTKKDKHLMISLIYGILKMIEMNVFTKQKYIHR